MTVTHVKVIYTLYIYHYIYIYSFIELPCSPYLTAPSNGFTNCTDTNVQVTNAVCNFGCNPGYHLTSGTPYRTCTNFSIWTGEEVTCSKLECPPLNPMIGYQIGRPCTNEYESICTIYCPDGYTLTNGEVTYTQQCVANGNGGVQWTSNMTCHTGKCML